MYPKKGYKLRKRKASATSIIVILVLLIIVGYVVVAIDLITCPFCENVLLLRNVCRYCNYDGKVTILEYVLYIIGSR